jgi:hypothetical protein
LNKRLEQQAASTFFCPHFLPGEKVERLEQQAASIVFLFLIPFLNYFNFAAVT